MWLQNAPAKAGGYLSCDVVVELFKFYAQGFGDGLEFEDIGQGSDNHELFTTPAGQRVTFAYGCHDVIDHLFKNLISHVMAIGVIDRLEFIKVAKQHGDLSVDPPGVRHSEPQAIEELTPICQAGQEIMRSQVFDF